MREWSGRCRVGAVAHGICSPYQLINAGSRMGAGCVFGGRALQSGRLTGTSRDGTFSGFLGGRMSGETRPSDLRRGE